MTSRRKVLRLGALALATGGLTACDGGEDEYEQATRRLWQHTRGIPNTLSGLLGELIRYATLAPSTYNSQCWRFRTTRESITILPDPRRRSPALDPEDLRLYMSLGCAAENLVQVSGALGLGSFVEVGSGVEAGVTVRFVLGVPSPSPLSEAIPARRTTRTLYTGQSVPVGELVRLETSARAPGVTPVLITDAGQKKRLLEVAVQANREWYGDPAKVAELKHWTRFDTGTALASRDGLAPGPDDRVAWPPLLGRGLFNLWATADRANGRLVRAVDGAAGLVGFVVAVNDRGHWVEAGRALQRFALLSTALGIQHDWVNAPVDSPTLAVVLGRELGEPAGRPAALLRFGYGGVLPRSLRRPPHMLP